VPPLNRPVSGDLPIEGDARRVAWRRWAMRGLLAMVVVAAIAQVPWITEGGGAGRAERLRGELATTERAVQALSAENLRLAQEIDALRTDVAAIEQHARDELGMVYPGELVLRVERPAAAPKPEMP
jgi:cell division protein FtsB